MSSNRGNTMEHRYNTRLRNRPVLSDVPDMTPRRRRRINRIAVTPIRCAGIPSFWEKYSRTLFVLAALVFIGATVAYVSWNQASDFHMAQQQSTGIIDPLYMLKSIANNMKSMVHKCKHCKDSTLVEDIRGVVREELKYLNSNKNDKPDYALESTGAYIISTRQTESYCKGLSLFGIPHCGFSNGPNTLIQPGVMPGECWAFKGQAGTAVIRLITKIYVTGVSVEHIPRSISPNGQTNSAPRLFSIWGLQSADDTEAFFFGQYTYDTNGTPVQHFRVVHKILRKFDIVEFKVHSNHGHREYTCIYRLRVHGNLGEN